MRRLDGKRAFVTGAGSGIGRAVAVLYAREGARVGLLDRQRDGAEETAALIRAEGGESLVLECDVSDETQVEQSVRAVVAKWGGLDVAVGVAGIELAGAGDARVHELELDTWRRTLDTNLTGMFLTCKYGTQALLASGGGSLIVTGSPCGLFGFCASEHAYSASKAGTHGLVRVMAADYARDSIRVNAIIPGFIDSPLNAAIMANPSMVADVVRTIPAGRPGRPEDVAPLYVWLASDEAAYVTGAFFTADGGQTAV
jgi:3-oxoacyl-[acyl-carrier protein] reductase